MQEAERIFNHHVYNVGDIRCIQDDVKSSCFLYLLSHNFCVLLVFFCVCVLNGTVEFLYALLLDNDTKENSD